MSLTSSDKNVDINKEGPGAFGVHLKINRAIEHMRVVNMISLC